MGHGEKTKKGRIQLLPTKSKWQINIRYNEKAEALNNQFKSVFSPATHESLPDMGPSHFPSINKFKITVPGILKPPTKPQNL